MRILFLSYIFTIFVVFSHNATADDQPVCNKREVISAALADQFGETLIARGITTNDFLVEVFAAPTSTFTIVVTTPSGISCVMAAGQHWENLSFRDAKHR